MYTTYYDPIFVASPVREGFTLVFTSPIVLSTTEHEFKKHVEFEKVRASHDVRFRRKCLLHVHRSAGGVVAARPICAVYAYECSIFCGKSLSSLWGKATGALVAARVRCESPRTSTRTAQFRVLLATWTVSRQSLKTARGLRSLYFTNVRKVEDYYVMMQVS